jgi:hypothetical protein
VSETHRGCADHQRLAISHTGWIRGGDGAGRDAVRPGGAGARGGLRTLSHRLVSCVAAGTFAVGAGCGAGRPQPSPVSVGAKVATRPGNVVTVYGWRPPVVGPGADHHGPGLELKSCRTDRHAVVLDAGGFTVRTAGGAVLQPGGSDFTAVGADCVTGRIFFDVPAGDEPEYALYRAGSKLLRWGITQNRPPRQP